MKCLKERFIGVNQKASSLYIHFNFDLFAKASADVGSQGAAEKGREVSDQPQAWQLPVLEELLKERHLLVVVRRITDLSDLFSDEAQVANQDRLVVGESVEGGLKDLH